ncbi:hypothetical protein GYMLUDRAFT_91765 [Collybiopsis luxurians FD-317 M1]|nr:hypothetical protein GYMLUDRAFT_91765 [Collybiopsis luxurians FD-317 M1]
MSKPPPLTLQQRRVRLMLTTFPMIVVTGYVLYKRLVLGEPQRKLNRPGDVPELVAGKNEGN